MIYRKTGLLLCIHSVLAAAWWFTLKFLFDVDYSFQNIQFLGILDNTHSIDKNNETTKLSNSPLPVINYSKMDSRMTPAFLELLPGEILSVPVWDENKNLISGGKPIENETYRNRGACSYPILDDSRPLGRCCLGSRSGGGGQEQFYGGAEKSCPQTMTVYSEVQQRAMHELESYPIQLDDNNPRNSAESHIKCDVCRVVQLVASMKHNRFAIVGDSIQFQIFTGLECELRRRHFGVSSGKFNDWPSEDVRVPTDQAHLSYQYGIKKDVCINVTVPEWMKAPSQRYQIDQHITMSSHVEFCYYAHYKPYPDMSQQRKIAESSDVLMIDYGLHYGRDTADEYRNTLETLLKVLSKSDCLLMYRETCAQHFESDGGEWETSTMRRKLRRGLLKCAPHGQNSSRIKWRTKIFREVVANSSEYHTVNSFRNQRLEDVSFGSSMKEVAFLPFFDWTASLFSLKDGMDCTHFCYTPHIYYSLWRHIRIALDRQDGQ